MPPPRRCCKLPAYPPVSLRAVHPHVAATGGFVFYRATFEQATAGHFEITYPTRPFARWAAPRYQRLRASCY